MQLHVFEAALGGTEQELRQYAQHWLAAGIELDGILWGQGRRLGPGGLALEQASIVGRPSAMLRSYADISSIDPLCWTLAAQPGQTHNIALQRHYASHPCQTSADYWQQHRVAQLLMHGLGAPDSGQLHWIKLLRGPGLAPFSASEQQHAQATLPLILQAAQLQQSKLASRSQQRASSAPQSCGTGLTSKELLVANAYAEGLSVKQIARQQQMAPSTVQSHLQHIFRKLDVHSKLQLRDKMGTAAR